MSGDTDLAGQVAVVTGGAGAIGSALAAEFAEKGVAVACLDVVDPSGVVKHIADSVARRSRCRPTLQTTRR